MTADHLKQIFRKVLFKARGNNIPKPFAHTHTMAVTKADLQRDIAYIYVYKKFQSECVNYISRDELAFTSIEAAK